MHRHIHAGPARAPGQGFQQPRAMVGPFLLDYLVKCLNPFANFFKIGVHEDSRFCNHTNSMQLTTLNCHALWALRPARRAVGPFFTTKGEGGTGLDSGFRRASFSGAWFHAVPESCWS